MMERILIAVVIALAGCVLTGCATTTIGPIAAGNNTYIISRKEGAFPSGSEPLLAEAIAEANNFCSSFNKVMKLIDTDEDLHIFGNYPKATVTFSCEERTTDK